jgi:hypothetical protein
MVSTLKGNQSQSLQVETRGRSGALSVYIMIMYWEEDKVFFSQIGRGADFIFRTFSAKEENETGKRNSSILKPLNMRDPQSTDKTAIHPSAYVSLTPVGWGPLEYRWTVWDLPWGTFGSVGQSNAGCGHA